jgi:hypothetical protein
LTIGEPIGQRVYICATAPIVCQEVHHMDTRKVRRTRRTSLRRTIALVTALGTVGLGVGLASPASAGGRYRDDHSASNAGCDSHYNRDSYQGRVHSDDTSNSNEGYCFAN